ncbi:homoserine kinase [Clostridium cavendishii DSM 21758]|uniref:Homoserine kinase n=1 Tax=Clostridium cavendishii DSM 21758 TaxID=1121302 RepID=A0A1M6CHJ8_9CLOT|nr:homoserine kinase [Clostridium cavendishii]SHI60456.1 homoserine kinase [Clostridium cavendishii DSM 21758]
MIKVKVPATSANIGAGFDCLGVALKLYNIFGFEELSEGLKFEGFAEEYCNEENVVYQAMISCFDKCNYKVKGIKITLIEQNIPMTRGLGSSSSCIVAGLIGANRLAGNTLTRDEILDLAVEIEGHPDNVAPAILGGMVVAIKDDEKTYYNKFNIEDRLKFVALIPDFMLATSDSRNVLPKVVEFKDAIFNLSRAAFTVSCFATGRYEALNKACMDKLHEPYRSRLIPNYFTIINKVYNNGGLCAFLSGAGPTIMSLYLEKDINNLSEVNTFIDNLDEKWDLIKLEAENNEIHL